MTRILDTTNLDKLQKTKKQQLLDANLSYSKNKHSQTIGLYNVHIEDQRIPSIWMHLYGKADHFYFDPKIKFNTVVKVSAYAEGYDITNDKNSFNFETSYYFMDKKHIKKIIRLPKEVKPKSKVISSDNLSNYEVGLYEDSDKKLLNDILETLTKRLSIL